MLPAAGVLRLLPAGPRSPLTSLLQWRQIAAVFLKGRKFNIWGKKKEKLT